MVLSLQINRFLSTVLATSVVLYCSIAIAQGNDPDPDTNSTVDTESFTTKTVISSNILVSPRAAAMGGAIAAVADDIDAINFNPAGIGGLGPMANTRGYTKKVYFPHLGATANQNAKDLNSEFRLQNAKEDNTVGKAIVDAAAGKRQYGRGSMALGMIFGRTVLVPFFDNQVAAVSQGANGAVDFRNRSISGIAYGVSLMEPDGKIALGYSGWLASGSETKGALSYGEILDPVLRKEAIKDSRREFTLQAHNVGSNIRLGRVGSPTVSIVLKHIGNTKFQFDDDANEDEEEQQLAQDLTVGFSVGPETKVGRFVWTIEAGRLSDQDTALHKKMRSGLEWSLGSGIDSYSFFSLRGGYNNAGASYGVWLNLGLVSFGVSSEAQDIGRGNEKFIERRNSATFVVNAAAM